MLPWRERNGEFSWFKALVFAAALAPAVWLAWRAGLGDLGPRPWTEAIHRSGDWALRFLLLSLAVTPVRLVFRWGRVMTVRRMLGLTALGYALLHLALYVGDMGADLPKVAAEIALRVYLTIGFAVVVGLAVLGATSPDAAVRRLGGRRWRALHRAVYPLAALGVLHFFMQSKLEIGEAALMAGALVWLLAIRVWPWRGAWGLAALAPLAAAAAALIEATWISLKAGAPLALVLAANIDPDLAPRPSLWVLAAGLAVAGLAALLSRPAMSSPGAPRRGAVLRPTH